MCVCWCDKFEKIGLSIIIYCVYIYIYIVYNLSNVLYIFIFSFFLVMCVLLFESKYFCLSNPHKFLSQKLVSEC
jgi:hypothetical protein